MRAKQEGVMTRHTLAGLFCSAALAAALPAMAAEPRPEADTPTLLNAATLTYDQAADTVAADGRVQLFREGHVVEADRLTFNRKTDVVTATGNVKIWEPTGEVMFAGHAELSRDLTQAFVEQSSIILTDDSRFIALAGERTEGRYVRMDKALYTACAPCRTDPKKAPLWQVRADRIVHDKETQNVTYRNASLELAGVPLFYTPYLSHPDPSVKRRSGFLAPVIGSRKNLGFVARNYYFLDIAPDRDATIEASYSATRGTLLGGEYRQRWARGELQVNASGTIDDIPDDAIASLSQSDRFRGHIFADGKLEINDEWRAGLNLRRATDDTYLELWNYSTADTLTSRAYAERFTERSYGVVNAYSFQDLRSTITTAEPQVVPEIAYRAQGAPQSFLGGRWAVGAETRNVTRSGGVDSSRVGANLDWRRDFILPAGLALTTTGMARTDAYLASGLDNLPGTTTDDAATLRPFTQAQFTARYPLVKVGPKGQQYIEPIVQLTAAPNVATDLDIPNEDSQSLEFDFSNLFTSSRFSGVDRLDGGSRLAYGLRGGWSGNNGTTVEVGMGQSYSLRKKPPYPTGSGLENQFSDFVGQVSADVSPWLDATYNFRLDHESLSPREHDLQVIVGPTDYKLSLGYLYAEQGSGTALREEITGGATIKLAEYWTATAYHRHNLQSVGAIESNLSLNYQDECLTFSLIGQRDHIARAGLSSGDSIFFRLIFKNLGQFESPSLNPDIFGGSKQSGS